MPRTCAILAAVALALAPTGAGAEAVGAAGAANLRSAGTPPGGATRLIEIGAQVVRNEKVETSDTGSVQIAFIDKTTLNIGPNSRIVIDRFVFNPATSTGEMALSLTRGVMRVVGGQATHSGGATVTTPVATIGIRGAIATLSHWPECPFFAPVARRKARGGKSTGRLASTRLVPCRTAGTRAVNNFGRLEVTAGGLTQTVLRPGFGVTVGLEPGATPSAPMLVTQAEIDEDSALLTSQDGQSGGSQSLPTDSLAAGAGLGVANRGLATTVAPRQAQTTAAPGPSPVDLDNGVFIAASVRGAVQQGVVQSAAMKTIQLKNQQKKIEEQRPSPQAYALTTTAGAGSNVPFLTASFLTSGKADVSPIFGYRDTVANKAQPDQLSRNFQVSLAIDGSGAAQTSSLAVMTSAIGKFGPQVVQGGFFQATSRDRSSLPGVAFGSLSSTDQSLKLSSIPTSSNGSINGSFATSQNEVDLDPNARTVVLEPDRAFSLSGKSASTFGEAYTFNQTVSPLTTPNRLGRNHPSETLQGYVGGIGQSVAATSESGFSPRPAFVVTNQSGSPGDVSIALFGDSSRIAAQFNIRNASASGAGGEFRSARLNFGEPNSTSGVTYDPSRGAYVDLQHFAALSTQTVQGDEDGNGLLLVSAGATKVASFFPSVKFCRCDFTQWGMWSMATERQDASTSAADSTGIAFFVAGVPAAADGVNSAIANNVTATYRGHVIASIANGPNDPQHGQFPNQYIAASNFTNTVNFGSRMGSVRVPSLDGASYAGTVAFGSNPTQFSGTLNTGTSDNRAMMLNGSFFKGAASPYGEMGGNVTINGTNYLGSGIFAARRN